MKVYFGRRSFGGDVRVAVREGDQTVRELRHVEAHSPDGFEWGYGGSGPADLALSILADYFEERVAAEELGQGNFEKIVKIRSWAYHQAFKWDFIADAKRDGWEISEEAVDQWLERRKKKEREDPL